MVLIVLDSKLFARDWKKILLIALVATVFLFFGGEFNSEDTALNIFVFVLMLAGCFIAILAIWTGVIAVWELILSLKLFRKQTGQFGDKNDSHDSTE